MKKKFGGCEYFDVVRENKMIILKISLELVLLVPYFFPQKNSLLNFACIFLAKHSVLRSGFLEVTIVIFPWP